MPIIKEICNVDDDDISSLLSPKKQKTDKKNCFAPLYRTSRGGRVQVLRAPFSDSIIDTTLKRTSNPKLNDKSIAVCLRNRSKPEGKSVSPFKELKFRGKMVMCSSSNVDEKKEDYQKAGDFVSGDVVWEKSGKKYPAWPGIVIDPKSEAPESVSRACVPEAIWVMYFGYAKNGKHRNMMSEPILHQPMGPRRHSLEAIKDLNLYEEEDLKAFSNSKERLKHLQRTEKYRVCFGKSGIHGARRHIRKGEMVIEYRGEKIRPRIANLREARYFLEGKDCYLFKINKELVIDATNKGCMARFINHSCIPNCYIMNLMEGEEDGWLVLFDKIDVAAGDELTLNYRFEPLKKMIKRCDYLFGPDKQDDLKVQKDTPNLLSHQATNSLLQGVASSEDQTRLRSVVKK